MSFRSYASRLLEEEPYDPDDAVLCVGCGWDLFALFDEPRRLFSLDGPAWSFCAHGADLYYLEGLKGKLKKLSQNGDECVARVDMWSRSICSHEGSLYHAGHGKTVWKVTEDFHGEKIAEVGRDITSLCSHKGDLYFVGNGDRSFRNGRYSLLRLKADGGEERIAETSGWVKEICSHQGSLYYALTSGRIGRLSEIGNDETSVDGNVNSLCSHGGELYVGGYEGEKLQDGRVWKGDPFSVAGLETVFEGERSVHALSSVPTYVLQQAGVI